MPTKKQAGATLRLNSQGYGDTVLYLDFQHRVDRAPARVVVYLAEKNGPFIIFVLAQLSQRIHGGGVYRKQKKKQKKKSKAVQKH